MSVNFPSKTGLLVCQKGLSEILAVRENCGYALPSMSIRAGQRIAPQIIDYLKNEGEFEGVVLFGFTVPNRYEHYVLVEGRFGTLPLGMEWVPSKMAVNSFTNRTDYEGIQQGLALSESYQVGELVGPFARRGWLDEVMAWVSMLLSERGMSPIRSYRQLNGSPCFSLMRIETRDGEVLWFKAVGAPNTHEYAITTNLSKMCPGFFPAVIGVRPDYNGWVMKDGGIALMELGANFEAWEHAVDRLGQVQCGLSERSEELLAFGCRDQRIETLTIQLDSFFAMMSELMGKQTKVPPPPLRDVELAVFRDCAESLFAALITIGIPCSFGHGDFGPHNIVYSDRGAVFIDLAEACVTHPFLTFQYLLDCFCRQNRGNEVFAQRLRDRYVEHWKGKASKENLCRALEICYVLTPLWYAMSCGLSFSVVENPQIAKICRSLVRLTHRRAQQLAFL